MRLARFAFPTLLVAPLLAHATEVTGLVRYRGPAPSADPVATTKDRAVCGESAPDERLVAEEGGLGNVVVRIVVPGAAAPPEAIALDQRGCRFVPHVQAATVGSMLELRNGDPLLHGVHAYAGVATAFDVVMATQGQRLARPLPRPGPVRIGCDVHGWMSAWVLVIDTPFHAVTDARGRFAIAGVPPGRYTAIAWHERLGERVGSVTVPPDGAASLELAYP
jgi:hypothetical protein